MKVFNLTDVSTKQLEQHKLVGHTVVVANKLLGPGDMVEVQENRTQMIRDGIDKLVGMGVLAVDKLPPTYQVAKSKQPAPAPAKPEPVAPTPSKPPKASKKEE